MLIKIPETEPIEFEVPTRQGKTEMLVNRGLTKKMMLLIQEVAKYQNKKVTVEIMAKASDLMAEFVCMFFDIKPEQLEEKFTEDVVQTIFTCACKAIKERRLKASTMEEEGQTPTSGQN